MNRKTFLVALAELIRAYRPHIHLGRPRWLTGWLPTRGNVLFTLVMIALLIAAQTAGALPLGEHRGVAPTAASTGTIAYQGRLADAAGAPLTGTYNMIFRLYAAATGGTPLWNEPWTGSNGVRVSDGLFNVMLGSLTTLPQATIAGRNQLFLGITVGTDDEMAPRVQLGSVPFAVQALTVPDGSVTTGKIADGAVTQAKLAANVSLVPPDGSITTVKIADKAVTQAKLGTDVSLVPPDGSITTAKIADGAVTQSKAPFALVGSGYRMETGSTGLTSDEVGFSSNFRSKQIYFTQPFSDTCLPVVFANSSGGWDVWGERIVAMAGNITRQGFQAAVFRVDGNPLASNGTPRFEWVAFGCK